MYGITPINDPARNAALAEAGLDVHSDDALDAVSRLAALVLGVPTGLVSIVDSSGQRFVGAAGLSGELEAARGTPLSHSYCKHVVESGLPLIVGDARTHPVTTGNPAIVDYTAIAYAGYPIVTGQGFILGTVCAVDEKPRQWSQRDLETLRDLARLTAALIDARAARSAAVPAVPGVRAEPAAPVADDAMSIRFFQAVFENRSTGVVVLDRDGGIIRGNRVFDALLGRDSADLTGRQFSEFVHPDDRATTLEAFERLRRGDAGAYPHDERCMRPDGTVVWGRVTASLIQRSGGAPHYAIMLKQDITRERAALAELRTSDAERARSERLRSLGELATGVAHDFNNSLTVITACTGMVMSQLPPDAEIQMDLHDIELAARKAAGLSQQLLRFARGASGKREPVDLGATVAEMQGMLRQSAGPANVVTVEIDPAAPPVVADKVGLQQIVLNLVVNARDALPPKGGTIRLGVTGGRDRAVLTVTDTGSGMTREVRERLFEPFFTTKGEGKGTGLGLATVLRITKEHGADISVDSQPGKGATFAISFPVHASAAPVLIP